MKVTYKSELRNVSMHVVECESVGLLVSSQFFLEHRYSLFQSNVLELERVQVFGCGTQTRRLVQIQ